MFTGCNWIRNRLVVVMRYVAEHTGVGNRASGAVPSVVYEVFLASVVILSIAVVFVILGSGGHAGAFIPTSRHLPSPLIPLGIGRVPAVTVVFFFIAVPFHVRIAISEVEQVDCYCDEAGKLVPVKLG